MKRDIEIDWEITHGCNLKCRHCIVNANEIVKNDVSLKNIINFLNKLKEYNVSINFTGGEPFFRKDFKEMLSYCKDNNIKVQIITNGLLLSDSYIDLIKNNNIHLGISIESFKKDNYEIIRGKNTFSRLINILEKLKTRGVNFDIYTTINYYNLNELEDIFKYAREFESNIHFNDITVDGRAKDNKDILVNTDNVVDNIIEFSKKYFDIDYLSFDDSCWACNETLFISSDGNIYLCTEEARCCKKSRIGNIKNFPINDYFEKNPKIDYYNKQLKCPYKVYFNKRVTYNSNVDCLCSTLSKKKSINSLEELYNEFDNLLKNIGNYCKKCSCKDCMGFIWLLEQEKKVCDNNNITTININENIDFLYFLKDYENKKISELDFKNIKYPKCEHRCKNTGLCKIHELRPLVCHMYPIGLESLNGVDFWVLHDECEFTQYLLKNNKLDMFILELKNIIDNINDKLYDEIIRKYRDVDQISLFLNGINSYIIVKEV